MRVLRNLLIGTVFVGLLVSGWFFAARNSSPVQVDYLAGRVEGVELWVALLVCFGTGAALIALVSSYQLMKMRFVVRRYRKAADGLEAELHQMRNLPLSSDGPDATAGLGSPGAPESASGRGRRAG